jgi:hypothetical protein
MENNIQLVKLLLAHLSGKLQSLDKTIFKPVKDDWEKRLISFAKKIREKRGRVLKCVAGQSATIRFGRSRRPRGPTYARGTIRSLFVNQEQAR